MNVGEMLKPYAIDISERVPEGLTRDIYAMLKAQFKGDMGTIVEAYKLGNDPDYCRLELYAREKRTQLWLFMPKHMEITQNGVILTAPNNYKVICEWAKLKGLPNDDILDMRCLLYTSPSPRDS